LHKGDPLAEFTPPRGTALFGLSLGVASITMAFAAGIIGYIVLRSRSEMAVDLPVWFWLSTLVMLVSSAALHGSLLSARADQTAAAGRALTVTTALGFLFLLVQIPGMLGLLAAHEGEFGEQGLIYPIVVFLIILHGLHVLGGLVALVRLTLKGLAAGYNRSRSDKLLLMSVYWHSLAVIWVIMFNVFLLMG
jgi:cytochrome c oxidase subunit III